MTTKCTMCGGRGGVPTDCGCDHAVAHPECAASTGHMRCLRCWHRFGDAFAKRVAQAAASAVMAGGPVPRLMLAVSASFLRVPGDIGQSAALNVALDVCAKNPHMPEALGAVAWATVDHDLAMRTFAVICSIFRVEMWNSDSVNEGLKGSRALDVAWYLQQASERCLQDSRNSATMVALCIVHGSCKNCPRCASTAKGVVLKRAKGLQRMVYRYATRAFSRRDPRAHKARRVLLAISDALGENDEAVACESA